MREVDRVEVIREVLGRRLRQGEASERLGICVRQVKRLVRRYREEGARGLRSRRRGRRASNAIAPELRREILGVVRERYEDFAPTLAWEKLTEGARVWGVGGDVAQVDGGRGAMAVEEAPGGAGSPEPAQTAGAGRVGADRRFPHAWFEDRGRRCTLIVFIDDATSRLMALRFAEAETTEAYMRTLRGYLDQHGRPAAIYSDKHSIFRVNQKDREGDLTQFTNLILSLHTPRKLSRNLTCRYRSREYQIQGRAAATASVAPPSPSVTASTAPSPSSAKARPSTTGCSLKARRPSPQTTKKASAVPSTRPAPSSVNAPSTNPPQTTPGTAGLPSTQPLPPPPHDRPPRPALAGRVKTPTSGYERPIRHSRESGNPGVLAGPLRGVSPLHPAWIPLSRE